MSLVPNSINQDPLIIIYYVYDVVTCMLLYYIRGLFGNFLLACQI